MNDAPRKPRIALMGEFSAGKSTLANLLLEQDSSPVQVTATQLPPVWYSLGPGTVERELADGSTAPLPLDDWSAADPASTAMIRARIEADLLYAFDLVDMPGTCDPCMTSDVWSNVLAQVDMVIWCTPANQAWRQSEAALWEQVRPELWTRSLLLVTRMDKMQSAPDRRRVLARVRLEAGEMFRDVLPIALTGAIAGRDDADVLEQTGAAALVRFLETALDEGACAPPLPPAPVCEPAPVPVAAPVPEPVPDAAGRVVPRRIQRSGEGRRERPQAGVG
ncbi:50S ribosome-binding GTPase [Citreicella sp. C3M06]|uniref:GTPase n=1 Tax=Citreicella sp. C3M06 TaxID=2841564 RepID=UPI001C0976CC|nr:GTPase [Citreicella sp. C3M06]MBU2959880.1 50S ribosome-binding GTPase [Citreicella sp. C3M06]